MLKQVNFFDDNKGISLIETMITIFLLAIIALLISDSIISNISARKSESAKATLTQEWVSFTKLLDKDFNSCVSIECYQNDDTDVLDVVLSDYDLIEINASNYDIYCNVLCFTMDENSKVVYALSDKDENDEYLNLIRFDLVKDSEDENKFISDTTSEVVVSSHVLKTSDINKDIGVKNSIIDIIEDAKFRVNVKLKTNVKDGVNEIAKDDTGLCTLTYKIDLKLNHKNLDDDQGMSLTKTFVKNVLESEI